MTYGNRRLCLRKYDKIFFRVLTDKKKRVIIRVNPAGNIPNGTHKDGGNGQNTDRSKKRATLSVRQRRPAIKPEIICREKERIYFAIDDMIVRKKTI